MMEFNRCDICLEESCNGKHNCNCKNCSKASECYRFLRATIRITNKCTQECSHCCFKSSPKSNIMMTVDMAKNIAKFLANNNVVHINLMGGEFFCNPNWFEILDVLIDSVSSARLVSNGDWANNTEIKDKLSTLINKYSNKLLISISKDKYHTNKLVDTAEEFLKSINAIYNIGSDEEMSEESIVPVGRSVFELSMYGLFSCYCHNPKNMYSFLIDENGTIYKCSFGMLGYDNINAFLDGGFAARFKEVNTKFYKMFTSSCKSCYMSIMSTRRKDDDHIWMIPTD